MDKFEFRTIQLSNTGLKRMSNEHGDIVRLSPHHMTIDDDQYQYRSVGNASLFQTYTSKSKGVSQNSCRLLWAVTWQLLPYLQLFPKFPGTNGWYECLCCVVVVLTDK